MKKETGELDKELEEEERKEREEEEKRRKELQVGFENLIFYQLIILLIYLAFYFAYSLFCFLLSIKKGLYVFLDHLKIVFPALKLHKFRRRKTMTPKTLQQTNTQ